MDVGEATAFADEGATQFSGYAGGEPKIEMEKRGARWFVADGFTLYDQNDQKRAELITP
jgi:hypothetical protein